METAAASGKLVTAASLLYKFRCESCEGSKEARRADILCCAGKAAWRFIVLAMALHISFTFTIRNGRGDCLLF